ncbi:MAG: hypothetical protein GY867_03785 [bacterium]|nr:hypothetical protein [bacterium]
MTGEFNSKVLICRECGEEFTFTASAQEYFASRGYKRAPRYCRSCHTELVKSLRKDNRPPRNRWSDAV